VGRFVRTAGAPSALTVNVGPIDTAYKR